MTMTREEQTKEAARQRADQYDHPSKWSDTYYGFIGGAKWADSHPQWIPVEERLPEKEKDNPSLSVNVIVTDGNSVFESYYSFNTHIWAGTDIYGTITHWMLMPPAPRKEE